MYIIIVHGIYSILHAFFETCSLDTFSKCVSGTHLLNVFTKDVH